MKIGELSAASSTAVETIRYYEREGLLAPPRRTNGNYRIFDAPHLERLLFIRYCRSLDMSLEEIRELLRYRDAPEKSCAAINALLDEHIAHVSRRIQELRRLERQLKVLRQRCTAPRHTAAPCGVLTGMKEASLGSTCHGHDAGHLRSVHGH